MRQGEHTATEGPIATVKEQQSTRGDVVLRLLPW